MTKRRRSGLTPRAIYVLTMLFVGAAVVRAANAAQVRRNVEIEWDAVEGATAYDVRVTRKDATAAPLTFKLSKSRWSANIKAGLYLMQLRAYDDRGVPGAWSPPSELIVKLPAAIAISPAPDAVVRARDADQESVDFRWEPIPGARTYRVRIEGGDFKLNRDVTEPKLTVELPVARAFRWIVTGVDERGQDGEVANADYAFTLKGPALTTPRPGRPLSKYADRVSWTQVAHAETYPVELSLYDRARRAWVPVPGSTEVATPEYTFDPRRAAGRYRLAVRANAAGRAPSAAGAVEFTLAGGFGDDAAMQDARIADSLTLPGLNVGFVAYRAGPVDYTSRYTENNSIARLSGVANTVRVGGERPGRRGRWGLAAGADVSAFAIQGAAFVYGSAEARATYRLGVGRRDALSLEGGAFARQLPVIVGSPTDGFERVSRVSTYGPALGAKYVYALNERWGLRGDARAYVGLGGGSARELGVSILYRAAPRYQIGGGLIQRHDEATFPAADGAASFARPGATDRVVMDGLLINLTLSVPF